MLHDNIYSMSYIELTNSRVYSEVFCVVIVPRSFVSLVLRVIDVRCRIRVRQLGLHQAGRRCSLETARAAHRAQITISGSVPVEQYTQPSIREGSLKLN
jgi:hypothetical protein